MRDKVIELIKNSTNVAIYIHINVDCDAMGSALATKEVLESLGKNADVYVNSELPNNFKFYGNLDFLNKKRCTGKYDLVICLDTATDGRIGKYKYTYNKDTHNTLLIDHHNLSSSFFCKTNYVLNSSSTAEILYDLFSAMKIKFTRSICKNLLSGIITDTGKFMHSLTKRTFKISGELLKLGNFKIEDIANPLFNSMRLEVFCLMQKAYNQMELFSDNKLALIMFKRSDFEESGATMDELDVFPDIPLQLEDVQFAILASEDDKGYFRVSLRSKGNISAKEVAAAFGGGGHLNASGCKLFGEYSEIREKLIQTTLDVLGWKR